jgi:hypothetical protein
MTDFAVIPSVVEGSRFVSTLFAKVVKKISASGQIIVGNAIPQNPRKNGK